MLRFPPPVWGLIYLVLAFAVGHVFDWRGIFDLRVIPAGIVLCAGGLLLMFSAVSLFVAAGTELNPASETNKALVVKGPYGITRNPMYLGISLLSLGLAFFDGSLPMFVVPLLVFATANWVHIPFEEAKMRRQFGAAYDQYIHAVRRWI